MYGSQISPVVHLREGVFNFPNASLCKKCPYSELLSPNAGKCGPGVILVRILRHLE